MHVVGSCAKELSEVLSHVFMNNGDLLSTEQKTYNDSLPKYVNLERETNYKDTWPDYGLVFRVVLAGVAYRAVVLRGGTEPTGLNSNLQFINCGLGPTGCTCTIEIMTVHTVTAQECSWNDELRP